MKFVILALLAILLLSGCTSSGTPVITDHVPPKLFSPDSTYVGEFIYQGKIKLPGESGNFNMVANFVDSQFSFDGPGKYDIDTGLIIGSIFIGNNGAYEIQGGFYGINEPSHVRGTFMVGTKGKSQFVGVAQ